MPITTTGSFGSGALGGAGPLTYSYTVAADADYLVVTIRLFEEGAENTSVTYNGVAMTNVVEKFHVDDPRVWGYIFGLKMPATGAHNVVITGSGDVDNNFFSCAQGFKGVDQTTPTGTTQAESTLEGTSQAMTFNSAAGRVVVDSFNVGNGHSAMTDTGDQTILGNAGSGSGDIYCDLATSPGAATVNISRSWTNLEYGTEVAVELLPAAAAGGMPYTRTPLIGPILAQ